MPNPAKQLTEIPVVAEQSVDLMRLFDAWLSLAQPGALMLHEDRTPGAAATLSAWAASRGLVALESSVIDQGGESGWWSRKVAINIGSHITIVQVRDLTAVEVIRLRNANTNGATP